MANLSSPLQPNQNEPDPESAPQILPSDDAGDPLDGPAKLHRLAGMLGDRVNAGIRHDTTDLLEKILSLTNSPDEDPLDAIAPLQNLLRICLHNSAFEVADPVLIRLIEIKEQQSADSPEVATLVASLAKVRYSLGDHESAEDLSRYVLEVREKSLAPNHFGIVTALEHLGEACAARGKLDEAVSLLERARSIRELNLGADHESIRGVRSRIADLELQREELASEPARTFSQPVPNQLLRPVTPSGGVPSAPSNTPRSRSDLRSQAPPERVQPPSGPTSRYLLPLKENPSEEPVPQGAVAAFYSNMLMQVGAQADDQGERQNQLSERVNVLVNSATEFARVNYKPLVLGLFLVVIAMMAIAARNARPERAKWTTDTQYQTEVRPPVVNGSSFGPPAVGGPPPAAAAGLVAPAVVLAPPAVDTPKVKAPVTKKVTKRSNLGAKKKSTPRRSTRPRARSRQRSSSVDDARKWNVTIPCRFRGPNGCVAGEVAANLDSIVRSVEMRLNDSTGK